MKEHLIIINDHYFWECIFIVMGFLFNPMIQNPVNFQMCRMRYFPNYYQSSTNVKNSYKRITYTITKYYRYTVVIVYVTWLESYLFDIREILQCKRYKLEQKATFTSLCCSHLFFQRHLSWSIRPLSKLKLMIAKLTQSHAIGESLSKMEIDIHQMLEVRMGTNSIN